MQLPVSKIRVFMIYRQETGCEVDGGEKTDTISNPVSDGQSV